MLLGLCTNNKSIHFRKKVLFIFEDIIKMNTKNYVYQNLIRYTLIIIYDNFKNSIIILRGKVCVKIIIK